METATKDAPMPDATNKDDPEEEEEEEELTGIDLEGIDEEDEDEEVEDMDVSNNNNNDDDNNTNRKSPEQNEEAISTLQAADAEELEAAKRERMELLAAEANEVLANNNNSTSVDNVDPQKKFEDLLAKSDVFAHFLAGSVAAQSKKGKKGGSRGKKGRMTEAEEDAQLLKTSQSKRRTVRLEKQPGILSPTTTMHKYQLEGLNWMIKLHDSGINGILADEMGLVSFFFALLLSLVFSIDPEAHFLLSHCLFFFYRVKRCNLSR